MRLTKQSTYAVRIVTDCAMADGKLVRIVDIARRYNITKNNVAKIVPLLVRNGIIEGQRGRKGGIRLSRDASQISVGEIVRACESTRFEPPCSGSDEECALRAATPLSRMLDEALQAFLSVLDRQTVAEMCSIRKSMAANRVDPGSKAAAALAYAASTAGYLPV